MRSTREALAIATKDFFSRHWNESAIKASPPTWSDEWRLVGNIPNGDKQGIYALVKEQEVLYIGVGASRNQAPYEEHGLGARLWNYIKMKPGGRSVPDATRPYEWQEGSPCKLENATGILTLGFDPDRSYLSYGLEVYLIKNLDPPWNLVKPGQRRKT